MNVSIFKVMLTAALLGFVSLGHAGHLANNTAKLSGAEGAGISGQAMVNFNSGNESWNAESRVLGLQAGFYSFAVRVGSNAPAVICEFQADGQGSDGCSLSQFDVGGFAEALILDGSGNVLASGVFDRNGGGRNQ